MKMIVICEEIEAIVIYLSAKVKKKKHEKS